VTQAIDRVLDGSLVAGQGALPVRTSLALLAATLVWGTSRR
jgi:hypothetical protein